MPREIPTSSHDPDYLPLPLPENAAERTERFGTDDKCRGQLFCARFPDGFSCLRCRAREFDWLPGYWLQCRACPARRCLLTGTLFENTKKRLLDWFKAIDYLRKHATTARAFAKHFKFNYKTAWLWIHKLRFAMQRAIAKVLPGDLDPHAPRYHMSLGRRLALWQHRGGLLMSWRRRPPVPSHGCERLDRHDLATHDQFDDRANPDRRGYPFQRWIQELGPPPGDSYWAATLKRRLRSVSQTAIVEKHLKKYLDEFAFFFNRRALGPWEIFLDLVEQVLAAPPLTLRALVARGPLRPWLVLDDVLARGASNDR